MTSGPVSSVYSAAIIVDGVRELGARLDADLANNDPLCLSLLSSSIFFYADLIRAIPSARRFDLVQVREAVGPGGSPVHEIQYPIPMQVEGQSILLIKDITDSGVIETYLTTQLRLYGARDIRLATLIDMPDERKTDLEVDYRVFSTKRDGVLVGYGLKHRGRYGNLSYIGKLTESSGAANGWKSESSRDPRPPKETNS